MGTEWALVDDEKKEYIRLGKRCCPDADGNLASFQIPGKKVCRFLAAPYRGSTLRLIPDTGAEYDDIHDQGYKQVAARFDDDEDDEDEGV